LQIVQQTQSLFATKAKDGKAGHTRRPAIERPADRVPLILRHVAGDLMPGRFAAKLLNPKLASSTKNQFEQSQTN